MEQSHCIHSPEYHLECGLVQATIEAALSCMASVALINELDRDTRKVPRCSPSNAAVKSLYLLCKASATAHVMSEGSIVLMTFAAVWSGADVVEVAVEVIDGAVIVNTVSISGRVSR